MSTESPVVAPGWAPSALFVDDDADVLAGIALTMRHQPFRMLTADSGPAALDVLAREPVAVVVSDEQMPGMSGTTLLAEVRRRHPRAVRMILSGNTEPHRIAKAINEAGVFRYLIKPCSPADLGLAVDQALEAHTAQQRDMPSPSSVVVSVDEGLAGLGMVVQPIFGAGGSALFGHEALLRLPARPEVAAPDLLRAAEREGRLWELERAIRASVASRMAERPAGSRVFVNLHPRTLLDQQLYSPDEPLAAHARSVIFEITERSRPRDVTDLADRMAELRRLGYRIAIDDMGSGYSGLTAFTAILPDFVKFDRELIRAIHSTPAKHKLVASIVRVCRELNIATIAEGIEDRRDLSVACAMGCTLLQGFLLGRPAPGYATALAPAAEDDTIAR